MKRWTLPFLQTDAPNVPPALRRKAIGFAAGLAVGLVLWAVISISQQSMLLGLAFGLVPGIAIGVGLVLTAGRGS